MKIRKFFFDAVATAIHAGEVRITQSHLISSPAVFIEKTDIQGDETDR
jgi:hypothetical protein